MGALVVSLTRSRIELSVARPLDEVTTRERPDVDPRLSGPERAAALRRRYFSEVREAVRAAP